MMDLPPPPAIVVELARCGLSRAGLSVAFDDLLQEDVVTISDSAGAAESMFPCIRKVVWGKVGIFFDNKNLAEAYQHYSDQVSKQEVRKIARSWMKDRGLLGRLPMFSAGAAPHDVAHTIERFCGLTPGTALEFYAPQSLTFKRDFLKKNLERHTMDTECLFHTLTLVDLDKLGISFGVIGNEAINEYDENKK